MICQCLSSGAIEPVQQMLEDLQRFLKPTHQEQAFAELVSRVVVPRTQLQHLAKAALGVFESVRI